MSTHVLLNLSNESEERDIMRGFTSFNTFNITGARTLDSIYHMTLKLLRNHIFGVKTPSFTQRFIGRHYVTH